MKKFLSIWMLMFLLWGLALPAAAEEVSPALLYAKLEGEDAYVTELTIPVGLKREVNFFTKKDDEYVEVTAAPVVSDDAIVELKGAVNPFPLTAKAKGTVKFALLDSVGTPLSESVTVNVPESRLEISRKSEDNWGTSLSGIRVNEEVDVDIRLGADGVFDSCTGKAEPSEGLIRNGEMITAGTAGTYTLTYKGYSVSVTVEPGPTNEITISKDDLKGLADQEQFNQFLSDNHYSGSGDLTLVLPAGNLGGVACNVQLPGNASLVLKGAANFGTNVQDNLSITVPNVHLDSIKFTGAGNVTVNPSCNLAVSNCAFKGSGYAFRLKQDSDGKVALLTLTNNSFDTLKMAAILDSEGITEVGWWRAEQGGDSSSVEIDFGVTVKEYKASNKIETLNINVFSPKAALISKEWGISFLTNCSFNDAYVVYGNKKAASSLDTGKKQITIGGQYKGEYIVVNDSYPKLVEQKGYYELPITANHKKYLDEVTLDFFPYAAANVTLYGKTVDTSIKIANGTRSLTIPKIKEGTYVIKETIKTVTTTKAVTKTTTKTTSRSYKYTYQDYYLVTPAGFANGMRYVKDNLVTLDCTQAAKKPISLPVASMAEAAEKGYSVLVKTKDAELTLDAAALKSLAQQAKGTTVLLHYKSLNHKTLTTVGQTSVQSHLSQFPGDSADLAFLVTATSDSETIEDLQKGTITLKIPFIVLPSTEGMENRVYALQSSSLAEARETAVADGFLTTKLLDLTEHMVFQVGVPVETTEETMEATVETTVETTPETTQPETEPETTAPTEPVETAKKSGGLIIGLSVVLVILCGALGFLFLRKRFQK